MTSCAHEREGDRWNERMDSHGRDCRPLTQQTRRPILHLQGKGAVCPIELLLSHSPEENVFSSLLER
jgi:hypothetical protein